jgi:N utilization substance protein B
VLSEAVELVTSLSTDESPRFVNGLLGRIQSQKARLTV